MKTQIELEIDGNKLSYTLAVDKSQIQIGRSMASELPLTKDAGVSKAHARIFLFGDSVQIEDLGSRNGTFVNGAQIRKAHLLKIGDQIQIGNTIIHSRGKPASEPEPFAAISGLTCMLPVKELEDSWKAPKPETTQVAQYKEQLQRFQVLQQIASSLLDQDEPGDLFQHALNQIVSVIPARRGCLMMLENDDLAVKAYWKTGQGEAASSADIVHFGNTLRRLVINEKTAVLTTNVQQDSKLEGAQSIILQGIKSVLCVPLWNGDKIYGLIYLDSYLSESAFNRDNLQLLTAIANLVTMKIENYLFINELLKKKAMEKDLQFAAEVQKFLQQPRFPDIEGLESHVFCFSRLELGGDYYHCFPLPEEQYLFVIADVMGKGAGAALLTASLHAYLSSMTCQGASLANLMAALNDRIFDQCAGNMFVTLFALIVDRRHDLYEYCSAGHPDTILLRSGGETVFLKEGGPILGILPGTPYRAVKLESAAGDLLLGYTDGLSEIENAAGEMFGKERLAALLREAEKSGCEQIGRRLLAEIDRFRGEVPPGDDMTAIILKRS